MFVNLYIPSTLRWTYNGTSVSLTQKSSYPSDGAVDFDFSLSRPTDFATSLRIPAWADGASISINGKRVTTPIVAGTFASLRREWKKWRPDRTRTTDEDATESVSISETRIQSRCCGDR